MGSLTTELPTSEMTATIELLGHLGVDRDGLKRFRAASSHEQMTIARMIQNGLDQAKATVEKIIEAVLGEFSTVTVPVVREIFSARAKFVKDTSRKAKVKIAYLGDNFTSWFLAGNGKIEDVSISESTLRYAKLLKSSVDAPIIAQLGGELKAETTLAELYALLEVQKDGGEGTLLTNGYANIFYIRDKNDVLRAVRARWRADDDGWDVDADEVSGLDAWDDGSQVFSRNSVLDPSVSAAA